MPNPPGYYLLYKKLFKKNKEIILVKAPYNIRALLQLITLGPTLIQYPIAIFGATNYYKVYIKI